MSALIIVSRAGYWTDGLWNNRFNPSKNRYLRVWENGPTDNEGVGNREDERDHAGSPQPRPTVSPCGPMVKSCQ